MRNVFSGHPLKSYSAAINRLGAISTLSLTEKLKNGVLPNKAVVTVVAIIMKKRKKTTKNNTEMAFLQVEDTEGGLEIIVFPKVYEKYASLLKEGSILVFTGDAEYREAEDEEGKDITQLLLRSCNTVQKNSFAPDLYLRINDTNKASADTAVAEIKKHPGESDVILYYEKDGKLLKLKDIGCDLCDSVIKKLEDLLGTGNVAKKNKR